jgi:HK97 family phage major capsid protein
VSRPRGFLTYDVAETSDATRPWNTIQFVKSGDATSVTADGLKNLTWTLRAPYRKGASFLMSSNTASAIDKLKDLNNNYIWRQSMIAGAPDTLLGYPVEIDESMPGIEAGSLSIAFANWRLAYVIADRGGVRFLRDPLTNKPNTLFYSIKRVGGGIANSQAIKLLKTST